MNNTLGFNHFWEAGDGVSRTVGILLLIMSILSWCFIFAKALAFLKIRGINRDAPGAFWNAPTLADGVAAIKLQDNEGLYAPIADAGVNAASLALNKGSLNAEVAPDERIVRALRGAIASGTRKLEFGQVFLASVGSTAPFVGLFGTVWGIYHALISIAGEGQIAIDKIAGPVGEALIMTAAGLAVAIPAVLAYNIFGKLVRHTVEELEGFAHDLHVFLINKIKNK